MKLIMHYPQFEGLTKCLDDPKHILRRRKIMLLQRCFLSSWDISICLLGTFKVLFSGQCQHRAPGTKS